MRLLPSCSVPRRQHTDPRFARCSQLSRTAKPLHMLVPLLAAVPHLFSLAVRRGHHSRAHLCPGHGRLHFSALSRHFHLGTLGFGWWSGNGSTHLCRPISAEATTRASRGWQQGQRTGLCSSHSGTGVVTLPSLRPASVQCGPCFLFCPLGCDTAWEPLSPGTKPRTDKVTTWKSKPGAQPQSGPCKARKRPSPASSLVQLCSDAAPSGWCSSHSARPRPLVWSSQTNTHNPKGESFVKFRIFSQRKKTSDRTVVVNMEEV